MVSSLSLYAVAATLLLLAVVVARLRGLALPGAVADGRAAMFGALWSLAVAGALLSFSQPMAASPLWRQAGVLALLASPFSATLGLRIRGRGSIPRALLGSGAALGGVVIWLTLNLRGPRGGWAPGEAVLVLPGAALALAAAACLGWWSKRRKVGGTPGGTPR